MTNEEKELLLKDLCARLPYGVMCHANEINLDGELFFINKAYYIVSLCNDKASGEFDTCLIANIKPYLRPMSSMTSKEWLEYCDACLEDEKSWVTAGKEYRLFPVNHKVEFLNAHHFDHCGLIPMGLALEAPEGMYNV